LPPPSGSNRRHGVTSQGNLIFDNSVISSNIAWYIFTDILEDRTFPEHRVKIPDKGPFSVCVCEHGNILKNKTRQNFKQNLSPVQIYIYLELEET
jgi:hypothetical protein